MGKHDRIKKRVRFKWLFVLRERKVTRRRVSDRLEPSLPKPKAQYRTLGRELQSSTVRHRRRGQESRHKKETLGGVGAHLAHVQGRPAVRRGGDHQFAHDRPKNSKISVTKFHL